jgi:penicillin-binding protein 1A
MGSSGKRGAPLVADRRYGPAKAARTVAPVPPRKPKKTRAPKRRTGVAGFFMGFLALVWRAIWGVVWRVTAVVGAVVVGATMYFYAQLPEDPAALMDGRARGSVTLLDRDGEPFAWRGETYGGQIDSYSVSPYLRNAVVASEDKRFHWHLGVSPRGIASAIMINLREGRGPLEGNGGSTITQQVAKLLCLGTPYDVAVWKTEAEYEADCRRGSIWRKVKEMPYAFALEARYSKAEILTIYLNRAYLGAGARGFEAAAQRYFGISANELNPAEAAMLAGLLPAPSYYSPTNNLARSQDRASVVLGLMEDQGYLTAAEADLARDRPATLSKAAAARNGEAFADWVMETGPAFLTRDTTEDVLMRSTFDPKLQRAAEEALAYIFETKVKDGSKAQAAIVVMSADGAVRAMVGGRATKSAGEFNRAVQARRQTGSAFKPFIYAAALDLGYSPGDFVDDSPLTLYVKGSGNWSPKNYTEDYMGMVTLTTALKKSLNIPAVRMSEAVGRDVVRKVAGDFGLKSDMAAGPALALGVSEATLLEMTGAYAGILNGGSAVAPYGLIDLRLLNDSEPVFHQESGIGERVVSEKAARLLTYMMHEVILSGTGARAQLPDGRQAAGKTGTTQAARDAWFIGFTADYVAGVWMGYDDNLPLAGVTGGGLPAEIWREVMVRVHEGVPVVPLEMDFPPARQVAEPVPVPVPSPGSPQPIDVTPPPQPAGVTAPQAGAAVPTREERRAERRKRRQDAAEQVLDDVMAVFGRNN